MADLPSLLTIKEAAEHFGVSRGTVRRWITEGRLEAVRVTTRTVRVTHDSVQALTTRGDAA